MIHKLCAKRLAFLHPCNLPSHNHQHELYRQRIITPHNVHISRNINVSYKSIHTVISTSQQSSIESSKDTPTWHMQRDAADDWLDDVLIERSSKEDKCNGEQQYSSIFDTASFVVENFISGGVDTNSRPLLRRVPSDVVDVDESSTSNQWSDMFAVLYGTSSTYTIHELNNNGSILLSSSTPLQPVRKRTSKKNRRTNLKLTVAYRGLDFVGWEDQRHELYKRKDMNETIVSNNALGHLLPSVQGTLVDILHPVLRDNDDDKQQKMIDKRYSQFHQKKQQKNNNKPIEIKVAGRTDKGVSAIGQVCRVRTYKEIHDIERYVSELVNKQMEQSGLGLRIMNAERVGNDFHPSFGATSRSYAYLIDLDDDDGVGIESNRPRISPILVPKLNRMLQSLEGKELDYYAMSHGKVKTQTTLCTLYHARAGIVEWNDINNGQIRRAICFEMIGNRFLRRMVRILVATTLRESYREDGSGGNDEALLKILASKDRKLRSRAAPPDGLIFVRADF